MLLENSQYSRENTCVAVLRAYNLIKKEAPTHVKNKLHDWSISACVYSNHVTLFFIISSRVRTAAIDIK